jgi:hypothetical protein
MKRKYEYKSVKIPKNLNENIAELVGVILGDGNLNRKQLRIFGNRKENEYYRYLLSLIWNIFEVDSKISPHMNINGIKIVVDSVKVCEYLFSVGLKFGSKIKNKTTVPRWIFNNEKYLKSCIRGLFDTDGSFFVSCRDTEPNILWKMGFDSLLPKDIRRALRKLEFHPTRIFDNGRKVALCRKDEIIRFFSEIKPKNNVQLARYRNYLQ